MKFRPERTHEAPELMREFGAEVFEEKKVYGAGPANRQPDAPDFRRSVRALPVVAMARVRGALARFRAHLAHSRHPAAVS